MLRNFFKNSPNSQVQPNSSVKATPKALEVFNNLLQEIARDNSVSELEQAVQQATPQIRSVIMDQLFANRREALGKELDEAEQNRCY